jgi:hypothetical protein
MTPKEYLARYRALPVYIYSEEQAKAAVGEQLPPGGKWQTVDVHGYRLGLKPEGDAKGDFVRKVKPHIDNKKESITVWVKNAQNTVEAKTYKSKSELWENAVDSFYGKGSPEEVQVTLQLAVRYGLIKAEALQQYCDNGNIGLDCNGFVGNFLRHVKLGLPWHSDPGKKQARSEAHASAQIAQLLNSKMTTPVNDMEDIVAHKDSSFIFAMCDKNGKVKDRFPRPGKKDGVGHIMISNPRSLLLVYWAVQPWYKITVLEATGGIGLAESEYNFLEDRDKGVFNVHRGSKHQNMTVRISRIL